MIKYFIWIIKLIIPAIYHYFRWILWYSLNPKKYSLKLRYNRVRGIVFQFLRILKIDINVVNKPNLEVGKKYYLVGNHVSFLDPVVLIALHEEPISFVSKIEVTKFPFVGRILKIIDGVFLERDNLKQEIRVMQEMKKSLAEGRQSWVIFPEGTRNKQYNASLNEFKAGSFKVPSLVGTEILPIAIWGTQVVLNKKIKWKRYPVYVHYLPLVNPDIFDKNTVKIAVHCQKMIQDEINDMREKHPTRVAHYSHNKPFVQYLSD